MFNKNLREREVFFREESLESLKKNNMVDLNDIYCIKGNYYICTVEVTDIPLQNNLFAKNIPVSLIGNIETADKLNNKRTITFNGDISGNFEFDGSSDIEATIRVNQVSTATNVELIGDVTGEGEFNNGNNHLLIDTTVKDNSHKHNNDTIENIDASKITSGIIDISRLPKTAINNLIIVQNDTERFELTKEQVQNGDSVKVIEPNNTFYFVKDDNQLNNEFGYEKYSASIKWETIENKPNSFPPSDHETMHDQRYLKTFEKHFQDSSTINSMKGYIIPETSGLIQQTDTLNDALGKLEKGFYDLPKEFIHKSETEPENKNKIWINPLEENYDYIPPGENNLYNDMVAKVKEMKKGIDEVVYSLHYKIDGGEKLAPPVEQFGLTGEYPELDPEYVPETPKEFDGIIKHICIARGKKEYIGNLFPGEFFLDLFSKELFIGSANGKPILIGKEGGVGGSNNLTGEFLELTSPKGEYYKLKITNQGKLEIIKSALDKQPLPNPIEPTDGGEFHENWDNYKDSNNYGLCINQIYSGGPMNSDNTPVSHSFIEIYNQSERDISLRGLSVQYTKVGKDWKVCPLDGILPGNTSYLIRCVQNTNPYKLACRVKINKYDLEWEQELSPTGMKVALVVGTEPLDTENPYRDPANGSPSIYRYIDMLCAAGKEPEQKIDYQEGYFARHCLDKNTSCCRMFRVAKKDSDDNLLDTMAVDYRYADIEMYGPKCREDGPWDIYRDKIKLPDNRPSMIFITFGKHQTTRIFTWQCKPTRESYLKIKEKGTDKWITYKAQLRNISHHDTAASSCTIQVDNLKPNKTYQYKCGKEGEWSDEYEFETFDSLYGDFTTPETDESKFSDREIKILHTTDQQGWSGEEYLAWEYAHDFIYKNEKTDFLERGEKPNYEWRFNTGDASQNGNRSFEWRYYYESAKIDLPNTVEMLIIGNNDLVDKKKSEAYTYYSNYEESPYPGCYEFFVGDVHFLSYNTWAGVDTDYTDLDGQVGYTKRQIEWLKEKLRGPRKRWTIVLTHVAPYTIVQQKQGQPYKEALEGNNGEYAPVDLVICGHNHAYSRSQPMLNNQVDKLNGYYNVMCQATGYKLSGKEKPDPAGKPYYGLKPDGSYAVGVPGAPTYIMWKITKDFIQFKAYIIKNIVKKDPVTKEVTYGEFQEYERELIDEFTFYHRSVREQHLDEL